MEDKIIKFLSDYVSLSKEEANIFNESTNFGIHAPEYAFLINLVCRKRYRIMVSVSYN